MAYRRVVTDAARVLHSKVPRLNHGPETVIVRQVFVTHIENNIYARNILLRTSLLWVITQRVVVIPCLRFGTICRSRNVGKELLLLSA